MFVCQGCDAQFSKWAGRCSECEKWGTLLETTSSPGSIKKTTSVSAKTGVFLSTLKDHTTIRTSTGNQEVDRVLGGGIVPGSILLLSGEPGIGKSTLVTSLAGNIPSSSTNQTVLYISGEESAQQLSDRFRRLNRSFDHIVYLESEPVEILCTTIEKMKPTLAIIDSIQTIPSSEMEGVAGSPNVVRYATNLLLQCAKRTNIPILVIGQVTKDGAVAGPKTLEHLVDIVLTLEGDPLHAFRLLRATKNRFGSTEEVGVFEMVREGLVCVPNPSERLLSERTSVPGSVIATVREGSRIFLVEIQALVEKSLYGNPVRRASGFDVNRLQMLSAILSKRAGLQLGDQDIYVNVIGGIEISEPGADLAVCAAIVSASAGIADQISTVYIGEVGLGGEIRSVPDCERRLAEAVRFGITNAVIPKKGKQSPFGKQLLLKSVQTISELT